MTSINNTQIYLERMAKPLAEKLKMASYIPNSVTKILDVGCADGVVTTALAEMFPQALVKGIDLNQEFINKALEHKKDHTNLDFECVYLRDMLSRNEKYDVVTFCSVLHEFYSYGEGISSVLKALSDAHELLNKGGRIIIRDMILHKYSQHANLYFETIIKKVREKEDPHYIEDFEKYFGKLETLYQLNHYILKYWYKENWEHEKSEHYVPVTFEQYEAMFTLLGMKIQLQLAYTIPYLQDRWKNDFGLTDDEVSVLLSTGILVAEKI